MPSYIALKTRIDQQNIHKIELKTLYFNLSDYYRTVFSYLSRGNEKLSKSQRFTKLWSVNYASSQTHCCIQISCTGKTLRENLTNYYINNKSIT